MTTYVLATDHVDTSARLCDYLISRLEDSDTVHAVNSLYGSDKTESQEIRDGKEALSVIRSRLGAIATIETRQFVRGNDPDEDVLVHAEDVDADELVIGVKKRTPTAKVVFGSAAQSILLQTDRPTAVVPLTDIES
ncbi:universal stress protein [Haloquadratum walsbyi]|jgi:Universal stress protein UspA and related nucleotide-binding proteins|uniref:Universal stress protein UspA related nucleotide-binding protein n=1 Tax=Haloquadratum walsbyi J07HQW2 TaxID=1238425 RepID=U1PRU4_9EURY|nr:universal stress protein [Haloquadratum walsbyi]ERG95076.1 MAG: universal stress protein UspA related nucleotide-binding protein [Haloquadratum walsbyi J07HQW2]